MTTKLGAGEAVSKDEHLKLPRCSITVEQIKTMSMQERRSYFDGLRLAESAVGGILCQPRFITERTKELNAAGKALDDLHNFLLEGIDLLVKVTRNEQPDDEEEAESKAWIVLLHEALCADSLPEFLVVAAQEAVAVSNAEYDARVRRNRQ